MFLGGAWASFPLGERLGRAALRRNRNGLYRDRLSRFPQGAIARFATVLVTAVRAIGRSRVAEVDLSGRDGSAPHIYRRG
jgi:hypothetical protein